MRRHLAALMSSVLLASAPAVARSEPLADRDPALEELDTPAAARDVPPGMRPSFRPTASLATTAMGGGSRDGAAGGLEVAALVEGRHLAAGLRLAFDGIGGHIGGGFGVVLGPKLHLSDQVAVGVLGELGIDQFSSGGDGISSGALLALGLRVGLTFAWDSGHENTRYGFTLGAFQRSVERKSVTYQTQEFCLFSCAPTTHTIEYGGTGYGAYLSFSVSRDFR